MKLKRLHSSDYEVFLEYFNKLKRLVNAKKNRKLLSEGKRVIVTTEIIDDDDDDPKVKEELITKAKEIGSYDNPEWTKQVINGLKQAGVQGIDQIPDDDRPVTNREIKKVIDLLINLINCKN